MNREPGGVIRIVAAIACFVFTLGPFGASAGQDPAGAPPPDPKFRVGLNLGIGLGYHPPFAPSVSGVPKSIRYLSTIPTPPHVVKWEDMNSRKPISVDFRLAPFLAYGPVSISAGIEYPWGILSRIIDDNAVFDTEDVDAFYEGVEREGWRVFGELGLRLSPELRITAGSMSSPYWYEFRSGHEPTFDVGSGMYWHIPEHGSSRNIENRYVVANETIRRPYLALGYMDEEGHVNIALTLFYEKNPFFGKAYLWNGEPVNFAAGPKSRVNVSLSFFYSIF